VGSWTSIVYPYEFVLIWGDTGMNCYCVKVAALTLAVLFCNYSAVTAEVIRQRPGDDFLVFEAEDFDSLLPEGETDGLTLVTTDDPLMVGFLDQLVLPPDTNASGDAALFTVPDPGWFATTGTWKLQFATAGVYTLYVHYTLYDVKRDANYDNEDSLFLAVDFNELPAQEGRFDLSNQGHNDALEDPPYWEGNFHWQKATFEDGSPAEYQVRQDNIGTVLDFNLANREPGNAVDLMVLSRDPDLDFLPEEDLDAMFIGGSALGLQAGDADMDLDFDQLDLVQVQIAAKYLTGQAATWGEGDWDGAPGGQPGSPPQGNGLFDQIDIISALAPAHYLTGPYAALRPKGEAGDGQSSIVYDVSTGEVSVDAPAGIELTSINIDSAAGIFTGDSAANLGGSFDNDADNNIFKATFGSSFGSLSFGNVAQAGLSEDFVLGDLTVVGSLAGGGDLGDVDLIYVPEPSSLVSLGMGVVGLLSALWRFVKFSSSKFGGKVVAELARVLPFSPVRPKVWRLRLQNLELPFLGHFFSAHGALLAHLPRAHHTGLAAAHHVFPHHAHALHGAGFRAGMHWHFAHLHSLIARLARGLGTMLLLQSGFQFADLGLQLANSIGQRLIGGRRLRRLLI